MAARFDSCKRSLIFTSSDHVLLHGRSFAGERPILVEQEFLFALGLRHVIDPEILKEVHAGLARRGNIEIAVPIEILHHELRSRGGGPIHEIG